jgi:3-hydroxy-9,10-secoandrosta-1,3,5(10)-triene-9,17-dione monooxygenase reductase component
MRKVDDSKVYRLLYPAVPVVIAAAAGGKVAAMPVASLISLSSEPAMVAFSSSPSHRTYTTIIEAECFSVSWLDRRFSKAIEVLGSTSGEKGADKLKGAGLHHMKGKVLGVPVPEEASAYLECRFSMSQRFGDHNLVVGEVTAAQAVEDFHEYWGFERYRPMLYAGMRRPFGRFR